RPTVTISTNIALTPTTCNRITAGVRSIYHAEALIDGCLSGLGIQNTCCVFLTKIIARNTVYFLFFPITSPLRSPEISTTADNQPTIAIQVFDGKRALTKLLGEFDLNGIPLLV
ncbi:ATPase with role in protein import into the ER, partial [Tulasnella sp. UAMH 9824]